jgi:amino acid transporter
LTILNARGIRHGGIAQNLITVLKVSLMLGVIVIPLVLIDGRPANFLQSDPSNAGFMATSQNVGTALILCLFSYSGAYFVTHVAEEISDPQRNIPKAIIGGFLIVFVLYLLINVTYLTTMTFDDVRASRHIASDVMANAMGPVGAILTSFVIFCSAAGVLNAQLLNYPRIPFALAKDRLFFKSIASVSETGRTPSNAIMLVGVWASILVLAGSYTEILGFVAFVIHFFICLAVLAVIILRIREPELARPYKVWGYPWTPVMFLIVSAGYLINLIVMKPASVLIGVAIVLAGLPFYWYWKRQIAKGG